MQNTLLQEQYQLHFGDDYPEVVQQATRFCKTVVNKPWWGSNRSVLLANEGGMKGMRQAALSYIIEKTDITAGLKAYGSYLRREYAADTTIPSLEEMELGSTIETLPALWEAGEFDSEGASQSQYGLLEKLNLSPTERDFFTTYASVRDVQETSILLGLSEADGFRLYDRVKHRAAYQIQNQ